MSDSEQTSMTRRQLLATVAKVGVSAPLAAAAGALDDQAPRPPSNVRVLDVSPVPPSGKRVLTLADLSFAGYIRFPADFDDLWYPTGNSLCGAWGNSFACSRLETPRTTSRCSNTGCPPRRHR